MVGPRGRRLCSGGLCAVTVLVLPSRPGARQAPTTYDLVIAGGHVIDPKNNVDGVRNGAVVYDLNGLAGTEWQPGIGGIRQ